LLAILKRGVKVGPELVEGPDTRAEDRAEDRKCDAPVPVAGKHIEVQVDAVSAHAYVAPLDLMAALQRQHRGTIRPLAAKGHALTSIAGTRHENEDYALAFGLAADPVTPLECLVIADGCGGHPGGRDASHLAVRHAVEALLRDRSQAPQRMVASAFAAASAGLSRLGRYWGPNDLRTTLIVVVATPATYHVGWIGDGGCVLHRADGTWLTLMVPHRGAAQNLLTASLGPKQEGEPSFAVERRLPGDRLYAGSDGVLDMVQPPEFFAWFEERSAAGDAMQTCLDALLNACASDGRFDDNLTVGVLVTLPRTTGAPTRSVGVPVAHAGDRESA
jgi:serine/threonine protein phosphatase PrpC